LRPGSGVPFRSPTVTGGSRRAHGLSTTLLCCNPRVGGCRRTPMCRVEEGQPCRRWCPCPGAPACPVTAPGLRPSITSELDRPTEQLGNRAISSRRRADNRQGYAWGRLSLRPARRCGWPRCRAQVRISPDALHGFTSEAVAARPAQPVTREQLDRGRHCGGHLSPPYSPTALAAFSRNSEPSRT
jgi:hypothetical protein